MSVIKGAVWILAAAGSMTMAGCVTTSGNLVNSAERLERSAYELHDEARDDRVGSTYTRDAQELAEESRDFRRVLQDRRSDDEDVREAFREVSERYHALRDEVDRSRDREAELDFRPVTEAYLDVEREMRERDGRDRYARDDD